MSSQYELPEPPQDVISAVRFSPFIPSLLLVSSWDRFVYIYDAPSPLSGAEAVLTLRIEYRSPVLDICFGGHDDSAFAALVDGDVQQLGIALGKKTLLSTHEGGASRVVFSKEFDMLVSSGWDSKLHIHLFENGSLGKMPSAIELPSKPHSIAVSPSKLVVAMASRQFLVYELSALRKAAEAAPAPEEDTVYPIRVEAWQERESSLKYMTRSLGCMPSDEGYAIGSIEGRVAVDFFDPSEEAQARKYAFKCHRTTTDEEDIVYPVNGLLWHPVKTTTFASAGGDGVITLWDGVNRRRVKQYPSFGAAVTGMSWSMDGASLAVGTSPAFEDGTEEVDFSLVRVFVRSVPEQELAKKEKK